VTVAPLRQALQTWYQIQGRTLPWRETRDPYAIWISEIMLQQTQVKTVLPYYQAWLTQFPDVQTLATAPLQTVLKAWEGLGYYARARNLHRAAQLILEQHQGQLPQSAAELETLPGIGRTTAGGIASAAFNQPAPILDGNVKRVLSRLIGLRLPPAQAVTPLWQLSETLLDPDLPRDFNQALMDLGAMVCTPKQPDCDRCPWSNDCFAHRHHMQEQIPMPPERSPLPTKHIGVAVIWNDQDQILIDRRPAEGLLGGLWEFPGGKIEADETPEECIQREIREELGIEIEVGPHLITVDHAYTHFRVKLIVHHCQYRSGIPTPIECDEIRWVTPAEMSTFPFPKANGRIIEVLGEQSPFSS
jgi:A/G-specific adenine glycosylase